MIDLPATIDRLNVIQLSSNNINNTSLTSVNITSLSSVAASNLNAANTFSTNLTTQTLSANYIETATAVSDYNVVIVTANKTFTNEDNSKAFHFQTSVIPYLSAIFPTNNLKEGFNVSIFNDGTGVIILSSASSPFINATGTTNATQNTAMFVYKTSNKLYGIGVLE
jgi:hypothetical protein